MISDVTATVTTDITPTVTYTSTIVTDTSEIITYTPTPVTTEITVTSTSVIASTTLTNDCTDSGGYSFY